MKNYERIPQNNERFSIAFRLLYLYNNVAVIKARGDSIMRLPKLDKNFYPMIKALNDFDNEVKKRASRKQGR